MKEQLRVQPMLSLVTCLRRSIVDAAAAWHQFWFAPLDPLMLGIMRLLTGWMLFYNLLVWSLELETFFGRNGVQPLETVKRLYASRYIFSFWLWIDDQYLWPVHIACIVVAAMFCVGMAARVTSILAFLITISYSQRVPVANFGFDQILGMMCLYLALAPSGAAVSVDGLIRKWWRRRKGLAKPGVPARYASARMASRLIQLHLCAIYFWAGFSKLKGPTWWTGEAMWNVVANQEYQTLDLTWMAWTPWLPYLISHITIAWETAFIVLIWNHRLRPLMLAMGTAMHIGIGAFLGMWTFGLIMTFAYLSFADPEVWRRRISGFWHHRGSGDVTVIQGGEIALNRIPDTAATNLPGHAVALQASANMATAVATPDMSPTGSMSPTVPLPNILVVATDPQHRSALREHFRSHKFDCHAVDSGERAMHLLHRRQYAAVLIHGSGFFRSDLMNLVSDVADYSSLPVLVLLAGSQSSLASQFDARSGVQACSLPASLREIRSSLEAVLARCGGAVGD